MASRTQCIGDRPTAVQAVGDARAPNAGFSCPSSDAVSATIMRQVAAITAVLHLLLMCSPSAVAGFVVPVVVDAVQLEFGRGFAHIGQEVLEATPAFTDANASPPVASIGRVGFIQTSSTHRCPYLISRSLRHSMGSLDSTLMGCGFASQTSAASRALIVQILAAYNDDTAALASAFPHYSGATIRGAFDCDEPTELLACEIACFSGHVAYQHISGVV